VKPGKYTLMISGITDDQEHVIQRVWYLSKETYEHFVTMLPQPHVHGMTPTEKLDRHGAEVSQKVGMVVLPNTLQQVGDDPTEQAAG
jgi:hypothetical protein